VGGKGACTKRGRGNYPATRVTGIDGNLPNNKKAGGGTIELSNPGPRGSSFAPRKGVLTEGKENQFCRRWGGGVVLREWEERLLPVIGAKGGQKI